MGQGIITSSYLAFVEDSRLSSNNLVCLLCCLDSPLPFPFFNLALSRSHSLVYAVLLHPLVVLTIHPTIHSFSSPSLCIPLLIYLIRKSHSSHPTQSFFYKTAAFFSLIVQYRHLRYKKYFILHFIYSCFTPWTHAVLNEWMLWHLCFLVLFPLSYNFLSSDFPQSRPHSYSQSFCTWSVLKELDIAFPIDL